MNQQEVSRFVMTTITQGLGHNQLCTCEGCVMLRNEALGALRSSDDPAKLTRQQAAQLAHDVDVLRRMMDRPRAAVARPLRALGFVPALSEADEAGLAALIEEMRRQNPAVKARALLTGEPQIISVDIALLMAQAAQMMLENQPSHPQVARWQGLIANLLYPEMDVPEARLAGVATLDDDLIRILIKVRNAGAAGELVGLSNQHQQALKRYCQFCQELGVADDDLPMIDNAALAAMIAAAPLAALSEPERQLATAFLADIGALAPVPTTPVALRA